MRKRERLFRLIKRVTQKANPNPTTMESLEPGLEHGHSAREPSQDTHAPPINQTETHADEDVETDDMIRVEDDQVRDEQAQDEQTENQQAEDEQAAKVAKHFEKTRVAMLRFLHKNGGTAHLKEMHDLSERRYFIAHRRFSDLMESLVDQGLIAFSQETNEATLSKAGRNYIEE